MMLPGFDDDVPLHPVGVYVIGSLRNPQVPVVGNAIRAAGFEAFEDWYGGGEFADDHWQRYEQARGRSYVDALQGYLAQNTFNLDHRHLRRCDAAVLVAPTGKSGHLELGFAVGLGKPVYYLLDGEPERWDVMLNFCYVNGGAVCTSLDEVLDRLAVFNVA